MTYSILVICKDASAGSSPVSQFVSILGLATCNKNETQDCKQKGTYLIISCWTFLFNSCFQFQICQSWKSGFTTKLLFCQEKCDCQIGPGLLSNRLPRHLALVSVPRSDGVQTCSKTPTTFFSGLKKRRFKRASTKKMWIEEGDASRSRANS